jgi:hypothetical protein
VAGVDGDDISPKEVPFLRRFYTKSDIRETRSAFYRAAEEAQTATEAAARAKRARDVAQLKDIMSEDRELIALNTAAGKFRKAIQHSRDAQDRIRMSKDLTVAEQRLQIKQQEDREAALEEKYLDLFQRRMEKRQLRLGNGR